jgi:probable rRNA maturation factor
LDYNSHELSVVITDNDQMQQLNKTYRKVNKPTNVLAFPMMEDPDTQIKQLDQLSNTPPILLGDIVISCETAQKEADKANISIEERMSQLLIHGILHLIGFDHETGENNARKMEDKSLEILRQIEDNRNLNIF